MNTVPVNGEVREGLGKGASKAQRNEGKIPCVMYGGEQPVHFLTDINAVKHLIYTADFKVAEISAGGNTSRAIIKDIQFHPVTDAVMHIDFLELIDGKTVKVELPIKFKGASPGVKLGGKLQQSLRRAKVKTTPEHLVDELFVDVSTLELGHSVRVRDIEANDNLEIMNPMANPVATVEIPRALRSAASKQEAGEEAPAAE